jgi:RNA polymerase-binding transcription factor DksA
MCGMDEKHILKLKETLEARKKELEEEIKKLSKPVNYGDDTEGNEDFSEEADEAEEFGVNLGIAQNFKKELADINADLERIEKGVYGKCPKCNLDDCGCK